MIHGHPLELRRPNFGQEIVLVDGREVSSRWVFLPGGSHHFDVTDEAGKQRHVELRVVTGMVRYSMVVTVDGIERERVPQAPERPKELRCRACGYACRTRRSALPGMRAAHAGPSGRLSHAVQFASHVV
ncbi:MAG: hypothetical protein ACR2GY_05450 [Phycisphaerales bacterium]